MLWRVGRVRYRRVLKPESRAGLNLMHVPGMGSLLLRITHQQKDPRRERDTAEDARKRFVGSERRAVAGIGHVHCWVPADRLEAECGDWCVLCRWCSCSTLDRHREEKAAERFGKV